MNSTGDLRVAIIHDWLTGMRGGEKVLEVICELYPEATLFTLLHNQGAMSPTIETMEIRTSFVQNLPFKEDRYRYYLPLFPRAVESFDLSGYDLVISSSHCVAKGAKPVGRALHICYCHTPMRYVWDQYEEYFGKGRADVVTRTAMSLIAPGLRTWDVKSSARVDFFVANSENVARRVERYYSRAADVIHAPVDSAQFRVTEGPSMYYLMVSALVPYKRIDLAIDAFNDLGERLVIIGSGPDEQKLKARAASNIEFLGWESDESLAKFYAGCKALIFPGVEDFGIVPLETMASGRPVIAYAAGGALETVVGSGDKPTGVFFRKQSVDELKQAVKEFESRQFDPHAIRKHAEKFDRKRFKQKLHEYITDKIAFHFK